MSLIKRVDYEPWKGINFIQDGEEGRIIGLLKDVRDSVAILKPVLSNQRLDIVLENIEKGEWIIQEGVNPKKPHVESNYILDLSKAKNLVRQYRQNSEGGCQPCEHIRSYMPCQDEHVTYCSLYEKIGVVDSGSSPRISEFYKRGCDDRTPILKRKLEKVLKDRKSE